MNLLESGEMYLETIYTLSKRSDFVRSIDICEEMGFSKPSVSRAMKLLKNDGYIEMETTGRITLTEKGLNVATKIYNRHTLLTEFFIKLGISEQTAVDDACKIEHVISDESMEAIQKFI
ncbi:MAG: metal-dependent transcriptional regulator [Lachnospiraceae bacterium]|nr:metal-dependent transcriptional regulator [Lachnospiraceae bacterium]